MGEAVMGRSGYLNHWNDEMCFFYFVFIHPFHALVSMRCRRSLVREDCRQEV